MTKEIIVALLALLGTLGGSFMGVLTANKLINYRIEQLETKVDKHNNLIDRTYKIERRVALIEEIVERNESTIEELREYHRAPARGE